MVEVYVSTDRTKKECYQSLPFRDFYFVEDPTSWSYCSPSLIEERVMFWRRPFRRPVTIPEDAYLDFLKQQIQLRDFWRKLQKDYPEGVWILFSFAC